MKKLYNILFLFIITVIGITSTSSTYTADYSAYDVAPQVENVPNKNKLDLFLNKVLEARKGFSTEKNYIIFVSKTENKLASLNQTYSGNQEISSMLDYLEEGVKNIKNISRQNNELDDFFCELLGECASRTTSNSSDSYDNSSDGLSTNSNDSGSISGGSNSKLQSSNISSSLVVSCKFEGDKDTLSISGKKWCEYARDKNKFGDRFQISSSQKLLDVKVNNGDLDCKFESYARTRDSENICNNTDFLEYIDYVKGSGTSNLTSSSGGYTTNRPKLKCPNSWSWGKSGSTERCTKSGGHYSCPDISGFGVPVGRDNPNHWTNVNGKITTCYYTYKGSTNNSGDSSTVRVASSGFGKVVEYYTCGTKEDGPKKRTYFFDEDKWNSRKATTIDGTKGPWNSCSSCYKYSSRKSNTLCGNDSVTSSSNKSYVNISKSKTSIKISTKNVPNGGGIVTLYGYVKSGDKCRMDYSTKGSGGSYPLASNKSFSSTFFVDNSSYIKIDCNSGNYDFNFNESGVTGVMCEGGVRVGGHLMNKGAKGSITTKTLHTGDSKGRYTLTTKFKCNDNLNWEIISGSKTIVYKSCNSGYKKSGDICVKESSLSSGLNTGISNNKVNASSDLDCSIVKDQIGNLYYGAGRCPDKGGYDYWKGELNNYSISEVSDFFNGSLAKDCLQKTGTTNKVSCFNKMFCPSGYSYIRNTDYCEK